MNDNDANKGPFPQGSAPESAAAPHSGISTSPLGKAKRRFRNFLLQPLIQIKLGLYSIVLAVLFSATVAWVLYSNLGKFVTMVLSLTDVEDEVLDLLNTYVADMKGWLALAIGGFLCANVLVSIFFTHKLVGPTIAFRRHIRSLSEGRYNVRTFLRRGDAFVEVADELNHLSEVLERQSGAKRD